MQDWTQIVRQLCDCFHGNETRLQFLHTLDQKILDDGISLEDLFSFVIENVVRFSQADIGYFVSSSKVMV
ncbi:MAG: hypothetical protein QME81_05365 [bacterium]|nr:hypothetical protein [bacterium]